MKSSDVGTSSLDGKPPPASASPTLSPSSIPTRQLPAGARPSGSPSLLPGDLLCDRFRIVRFLAAGGMGEVYEAEDLELREAVAIKTLRSHIAQDPRMMERFRREVQLARRVTHPNVCRIFDVFRHRLAPSGPDVTFLSMELLPGESLSALLRRRGRLGTAESLPIVGQMVAGLAAAHRAGVVHRDFKSANVLLVHSDSDPRAVVTDFGLAQASAKAKSADASLTATGEIAGSPAYMAPEQVQGGDVGVAADVYALGVVMYEMVTGVLPFAADTPLATALKRLREAPESPRAHVPDIDPRWEATILRCLELEPSRRFATVEDVLRALTGQENAPTIRTIGSSGRRRSRIGLALAAVAAVVSVAGGLWMARRERPTRGENSIQRVAVLPFENVGAPEDDYFADGVSDEIRSKLTSLSGVEVIARGSSTPYKKSKKTPKQIAEELNVSHLLTATVRWQKGPGGNRVHVTPELVEVKASGEAVSRWQQPFDAAVTDVFQVQSDIASRVAQALGVALRAGDEKRLSEKPTEDLAAYDAFLKGEEASKGMGATDPPSVRRALGFYEQAVALDPGFAQAWSRVSAASSTLYVNSVPTREQADRARQAAEKAAALAPNRPEGYLALGIYEQMVASDFGRSLAQLAKGQRLAPTSAELVSWTARAEASLGRWDDAVEHLRQAARLDPRSIVAHRRLGWALLYLRRYPEAREVLDRGLALAPANLSLIQQKAMLFLGMGDLAGARAVLVAAPRDVEPTALVVFLAQYWDLVWLLDEEQQELLFRLTPSAFDDDRATWAICLAQAYASRGDASNARTYAQEAKKSIEELLRATPNDPQRHVSLGLALAYLGRKDEAIREGERGAALLPVAKDAYLGSYIQHQVVRIFILVGEPEKALERLEMLLKVPYYVSAGWLRIDPNFDSLRGNPRFQKLVAGAG
jgi:serine/threonine protein kinase/tetratricopeptide (TPR) repeat protein